MGPSTLLDDADGHRVSVCGPLHSRHWRILMAVLLPLLAGFLVEVSAYLIVR